MGLVERTLDSGLIVAQYGGDHASIERELKRRDPDLSLQGRFSEVHGCVIWRVVLKRADQPFETVCNWQSPQGEPYPLSSGILNMVDGLDRNTRSRHVGEDEINAARDREIERQKERDREAIVDDHVFRHGRPVLHRSQSLRMSRDKQRAKGWKR